MHLVCSPSRLQQNVQHAVQAQEQRDLQMCNMLCRRRSKETCRSTCCDVAPLVAAARLHAHPMPLV